MNSEKDLHDPRSAALDATDAPETNAKCKETSEGGLAVSVARC